MEDSFAEVKQDARLVLDDIERASKSARSIGHCDSAYHIITNARDAIEQLDDAKKRLICLVGKASRIK